MHDRKIDHLEGRIVNSLSTSAMSADQLYEHVYTSDSPRLEFDEALDRAVATGRLMVETKDFRTPDNANFRVRLYFIK